MIEILCREGRQIPLILIRSGTHDLSSSQER
jgi:hypothetical protein